MRAKGTLFLRIFQFSNVNNPVNTGNYKMLFHNITANTLS